MLRHYLCQDITYARTFLSSSGLLQLQDYVRHWRAQALAPSTRALRERHWNTYVRFCDNYNLKTLPCTVFQASSYIAYLGLFMKYSSVLTYYQAVVYGHRLAGLSAPSVPNPLLKDILKGLLHQPSGPPVSKDPLRPEDLKLLFTVLPLNSDVHFLVWVALLVMFRALLWVSHIIRSPHTLTRADVKFYHCGVTLICKKF